MEIIKIKGWTREIQVVSLVQELRNYVGTLSAAKVLVDGLLVGKEIVVQIPDNVSLQELRDRFIGLGVVLAD